MNLYDHSDERNLQCFLPTATAFQTYLFRDVREETTTSLCVTEPSRFDVEIYFNITLKFS